MKSRFDFEPFTEEARINFKYLLTELQDIERWSGIIPDCREKAIFLTKLEEAAHWCCMAIVRGQEDNGPYQASNE